MSTFQLSTFTKTNNGPDNSVVWTEGRSGEAAVAAGIVPAASNSQRLVAEDELQGHILVVEDDPPSARMLEAKLKTGSLRVTIVNHADEAKQAALRDLPDLIICDVCLPGTCGIELTRWLRVQPQTAMVPVLLVTGMDDTKVLARGLDAGADDFLTKPVNTLELKTRVKSLLRTKKIVDEFLVRQQAGLPFEGLVTTRQGASEPRAAASGQEPPSPSAATRVDEIVIIEDHPAERKMLEAFLSDISCQVFTALDGESGIALLQKRCPSLLVLDLLLPDVNGFDLISRVKRIPELAHMPILVVSSLVDIADRVRALELGADDFIVKGFNRMEFKARVQRLLRLKRCFDHLTSRCNDALRLSMTDSLTGLYTHGFIRELVQREVAAAQRNRKPLSLLFVDIDRFKQVNDRFGHAFGDRVLKAVADCLRRAVRSTDAIARYGGDEFVIILPQTKQGEAIVAAERIRQGVAALELPLPPEHGHELLSLTASVGIAGYPDDVTDPDLLLQNADEALYAAKRNGRNKISVYGQCETADPTEQCKVLIVDDEERNIRLLEAYLAPEGCQILTTSNGKEVLEIAQRSKPDLILLDAIMPGLTGFEVCRRLKQDKTTCLIPVVLVTSLNSQEDKLRGIEVGADDFLSKPVNKVVLLARVKALLRGKRNTDMLEDAETVIFTLARAVEGRDHSTGGHVERVSHYAVELGKAIGLPESQIDGLRRAGVVHDIGKIVVPDSILLKPGALTPEERKIMERHVEIGYELLRPLRTFAESLPAVRFHHERLNGSGYPLGLRGDQIPLVAQIMAIVDVFDALTTDRCYRSAMSQEKAFQILRDEVARGLHDADLVETFIRLVARKSD